ncbi:hypothetical protein K461DRAFT_279381 [Myriangium duriaei CBS 260.36]|uniref:Uncharacterized protein n=1 Tax=Myriangium duriaei CBS 260.36 TaxID=1168546 RepID=A0A9P4IXS9_9PEZI|nr:hypothetical protein K461DRAFT_279381 [Myriangium duriaei CBS 260.36]
MVISIQPSASHISILGWSEPSLVGQGGLSGLACMGALLCSDHDPARQLSWRCTDVM